VKEIARKLKAQGGCLLVIDYGYTHAALPPQAKRDTLQGVKSHHYHDVLSQAGEVDLTAHVDFTTLAEVARAEGLQAHGIVPQGVFLERLGGALWLKKLQAKQLENPAQAAALEAGWHRLTKPDQMGALFKVIAFTPHPCQLAGFR
jgi:SAM-dependent MidA family methyltransferase